MNDEKLGFQLFLKQVANAFTVILDQAKPMMVASYSLIGAILLLGGIGYTLDWWLKKGHLFLLIGIGLGIVVGFYELVKVVFKK